MSTQVAAPGAVGQTQADRPLSGVPWLTLVALVAVTALGLAGIPSPWFTVLVEGTGHGGYASS